MIIAVRRRNIGLPTRGEPATAQHIVAGAEISILRLTAGISLKEIPCPFCNVASHIMHTVSTGGLQVLANRAGSGL